MRFVERSETTPAITAVHVEDSDLDAELFQYYVNQFDFPVHVIRLRDGQEALDFLKRDMSPAVASRTLVILDLGLPKISGQDVLKQIHHLQATAITPQIIVLSGSSNPRDRDECAALGVNDYFVKPFGLVEYESLIVGPIRGYLNKKGTPDCPK